MQQTIGTHSCNTQSRLVLYTAVSSSASFVYQSVVAHRVGLSSYLSPFSIFFFRSVAVCVRDSILFFLCFFVEYTREDTQRHCPCTRLYDANAMRRRRRHRLARINEATNSCACTANICAKRAFSQSTLNSVWCGSIHSLTHIHTRAWIVLSLVAGFLRTFRTSRRHRRRRSIVFTLSHTQTHRNRVNRRRIERKIVSGTNGENVE